MRMLAGSPMNRSDLGTRHLAHSTVKSVGMACDTLSA